MGSKLLVHTTESLHTNCKYIDFISNPCHIVHPNEKFKIQQNEMVKKTYVPNTIRILIHGVDFSHQGLRFWERTRNRQWSRYKVSRGEGMKRERDEEEREREGSHILPTSHAMVVVVTESQ
jgi:hypothetical protein